jgi:hypothetical protein
MPAKESVEALEPLEQLRLISELTYDLTRKLNPRPRRSIMELRGLGKEIWQDVDVDEYIKEERSSWDR